MKKIFIFLLFFSFYSCNSSTSVENEDKYFNPQDLSKLDIYNFDDFWEGETIIDTSAYVTSNFNSHPNFLKAINVRSQQKSIAISIFKASSDALSAMEGRINTVACIIIEGDSVSLFKNKWWITDCIPNAIFMNQWNTIIEVSYYQSEFEEVKGFLIQSISEMANRVDKHSQ